MARTRLRNERWGFETNCYVCEPRNDGGMQLPFEHDDELDAVVCEFTLGERWSGAPRYVHGGVLLSILDEAMAWATIAIGGRFAVTEESSARFLRPVKVDRAHRCEARVVGVEGERLSTTGVVYDRFDQVCVEATATFHALLEAQAVDAIGAELTDVERGFLGPTAP